MTCYGKNAQVDQPLPEQPDHHTLLIFKRVRWSIRTGSRWSEDPVFPPFPLMIIYCVLKIKRQLFDAM
jgi:hypothetical protein